MNVSKTECSNQRFKQSSKYWLFLLFPTWLGCLIVTLVYLVRFFEVLSPGWDRKLPLMSCITFLFLVSYLLFLVIYLRWAINAKKQLMELLYRDRQIVFRRYNRYFFDEDRLRMLGLDRNPFFLLRQRDILDSVNESSKKGFNSNS
jgi:cell division septal protein FtsQ